MGAPVDVEELLALGRAAGLDAVGVASAEPFAEARQVLEERKAAGLHGGMAFTYRNPARSTDPARTLPGVQALVVAAVSYRDPARPDRPDATAGPSGRVARYMWDEHYARLDRGLGAVAAALEAAGWRSCAVSDQNHLTDRAAAQRAGLGWFGKSANLLVPGLGSWVLLGSVLTDAPLPPAAREQPDGCGSCTACLDGCPTGAIVGPGVVDARRCLAWLVQAPGPIPPEFRVALGDRIYGCDDCQDVCPPNRVDLRRRGSAAPARPDRAWVALLGLLAATDEELLERHGRWYISQRDPRWLRRNALVALGNVADPTDPAVADALRRHLTGPDPMLSAHALWAARRLGRADLAALADGDDRPEVVAERALAVAQRA